MEPQLPTPSRSPEDGQAHFSGGEVFSSPNTSETQKLPHQPERQETREQHVGGPTGDPAAVVGAPPALPALPTLPAPSTNDTSSNSTAANPVTAADEDLIEKEWVEKAKKVIAQTKHDPYLQEHEVGKLQADYLKKRYGKTINLPTEG